MNDKVTSGEIYRMIVKIDTRLAVMESDMGRRLSTLEIWKAEITGKIAVVVVVISIAISFIIDWLKDKTGMR
jgi:hypothetical protein